jgi:hypothetical protein
MSGDVIRELKNREGEIAAGKQREAALRAALQQAMRAGFVFSEGNEPGELDSGVEISSEAQQTDNRNIAQTLLYLKHSNAVLRVSLLSL